MNTEELPKTLLEAVAYFADESRAHDFLVAMRWPDGVRCAHCNSENIGGLSVSVVKGKLDKNGKRKPDKTRRVWNCKACKQQFTAKLGTIFSESALPLSKWLPALWLVVNAKNGVSSCELGRALGVTQKTAWFMGHRIRTSIQRGGGIVNLSGVVEVDETYIGGLARFMHAKVRKQKFGGKTGPVGKTVVMGLLEKHSGKTSRVRAEVLPSLTTAALDSRVRKYVLKGSEVHTDENQAYRHLTGDYVHKFVSHAETYVKDGVHTNGLENFWCLLKRGIKGTYVHCAPFHLFRYLDEQTYRFNERKENDQARFVSAVQTAKDRRLTWKKLTGKSERKNTSEQ